MKYTVRAITKDDCNCEDCRAGRHLYELFQWEDGQWRWVGTVLQTYASAAECKGKHYWGLSFGPEDTWEDGTPIKDAVPTCADGEQGGTGERVALDADALMRSAEALAKHWGKRQ
jgi:hypothetical protein